MVVLLPKIYTAVVQGSTQSKKVFQTVLGSLLLAGRCVDNPKRYRRTFENGSRWVAWVAFGGITIYYVEGHGYNFLNTLTRVSERTAS